MLRSFVRTIITGLVLLALSSSCSVAAFTGRRAFSTAAPLRRSETKLDAWSLPIPSELSSFGTMKSTWYNEHNPTARRTVYDDRLPMETSFLTLGSDWPSALEMEESESANENANRGRPNPLKRVTDWAANRRRRMM